MKVAVQLFGPLAEQAGRSRIDIETSGSSLKDVVAALLVTVPALRVDRSVRYAINTDYAEPGAAVREGDVVSLIPPVGGG
jgi:molybdopterin converting factor small subunit